jgi:DNA-binding NarL/FixJ family response regulator
LQLLRHGASNAEIAATLTIAEPTVKSHVASLMEKLRATDRAGVVGRSFDLGLLKAEQ